MAKLASHRPQFEKLKLIDPAGNDIGVTLHVIGKDSKQYHSAILKKSDKLLSDDPDKRQSAREAQASGAEIICALVVGVDEEDAFDSPDFKKELYDLLLTGEYDWVAEQVLALANKREAFYKGSQSNSASA